MDQLLINYAELIDEAMHNVVRRSLEILEKNDDHGDHHFFISFLTKAPGVTISSNLKKKYPEEMTIVLQYQFDNLVVGDKEFSVSLSFNGIRENISVPYLSLTSFSDPSVNFSIAFAGTKDIEEIAKERENPVIHRLSLAEDHGTTNLASAQKAQSLGSNVVCIDSFRKDKKR